jgi:hypothetical protein
VFHTHIAKVDRDIAHVVMVVHVCCKLLFLMFYLFFSDICCKCVYLNVAYVFTHTIQVFYLNVVYIFIMVSNVFQMFLQVFHTHVLNVSFVFRVYCNCCI